MLFRLIAAFVRLLLLPWHRFRRARAVPRGAYLTLTIDGAVADVVQEPRFWEVWRTRRHVTSLYALGKLVDAMLDGDRVRGLVVTLKAMHGGMATATSLRGVLGRVRAAGRELVVHLPLGGTTKEIYVASVADRIFVGPQALVAPLGFATATRYVRGAVDRLGLEPEVFARGTYKSAGEQLVRTSMSDAQREQVGALLDVFYDHVVEAVASGRRMATSDVRARIDRAPFRAEEAVAEGLVDAAAYEDELPRLLAKGAGEKVRFVEAGRFLALDRAARLRPIRRPPLVGVIAVHGAIASQTATYTSSLATDERLIAAVRAARHDRRIRAVILHVDSPGGSALASDRIHHELEQLAAEKPLVCCMADVAASGGYYVAAPAHAIVAQPTTITGSIGVVAARVVIEPLLARLGVFTEIVKRGAHADLLQPTRRLDDAERAAFDRELEGMYQAFVGIVARGRKRAPAEIAQVAEGRVWAGADAAKHGLVDALGGFDEAMARARALLGGAPTLEAVVLRPGKHVPPLDPPARKAARAGLDALDAIGALLGVDLTPMLVGDPILAYAPIAGDVAAQWERAADSAV